VSQEQKRLRQFILDQVEAVRDESDRKSKLRLVIEPRSSRQDPAATVAALLVNTSLETRYALNLTWLGLDGLPETKGLVDILREWGEWRVQTVRRRTQHRLDKCEERLHIVLGRLLAFAKIDEIIKLIRAADDQAEARQKMMAKWKFSERQAEDIVNIRLGQLTKLDGVKLNDERKSLEAQRKDLRSILGDDKQLKKLVVKELEEDAKRTATSAARWSRPRSAPRSSAPWSRSRSPSSCRGKAGSARGPDTTSISPRSPSRTATACCRRWSAGPPTR
jgi:topoisomerase IV subunit A